MTKKNKNALASSETAKAKELNYADYNSLDELLKAVLIESEQELNAIVPKQNKLTELLRQDVFSDKDVFDGACKIIAKKFEVPEKAVTALWQEIYQLEQPKVKKTFKFQVEPTPSNEPVKPHLLFDDIVDVMRRYIVFPDYGIEDAQAKACSLWVMATWAVDSFNYAPYLMITAPVKRCGKTQLLNLMAKLSRKALPASNVTPSSMFRVIEEYQPTMFIDEVDSFLGKNEELHGIVNCGNERHSSGVIRTEKQRDGQQKVQVFDTFGFKALAGIKADQISSTITDRSIVIKLERKLTSEPRSNLRDQPSELWEDFNSRCARVALDYKDWLLKCKPKIPANLDDRNVDKWEVLLSVAELLDQTAREDGISSNYADTARQIAVALTQDDDDMPESIELLSNIRELYKECSFKPTNVLIEELNGNPEWRWSSYRNGNGLYIHRLKKLLKPFQINARQETTPPRRRGYFKEDFEETFKRYLKEETDDD